MLKAAARLARSLAAGDVNLRWYGPTPDTGAEWDAGLEQEKTYTVRWPRPHIPGVVAPELRRMWSRWAETGPPHIIHAHGLKAAAAAARLVSGDGGSSASGRPAIIVTLHSIPFHDPEGRRPVTRLWSHLGAGLRKPARIVCVSHHLARWVAERLPHLSPRLVVIRGGPAAARARGAKNMPAGGDRSHSARHAAPAEPVLSRAGPAGGPLWLVGAVARFSREKGLDILMDAFHRAAAHRDKEGRWRLVLMGDGPERGRLQIQARRLGLGDRILFPGFVPRGDKFMAALDVLVVPSRSEGLGLAALEGMAAGVPVIATAAGGLAEALDYGRCGRLVSRCCPEELADAIGEMWANPGLREHYAAVGREHAKKFCPEAAADRYRALYSAVTHGRARRTPRRGW